MSSNKITDDQMNEIINRLNKNYYISDDSSKSAVASDDTSVSKSFISNIVILVIFIISLLALNIGFKPAYNTLFNRSSNKSEQINTMNFVWWVISAFIILFSLIIGFTKSASHIIFSTFYIFAFFICLNQIFSDLDFKEIKIYRLISEIGTFFNVNAYLFIGISIVMLMILSIFALSLKIKNYVVDILAYLGYTISIVCALIATYIATK